MAFNKQVIYATHRLEYITILSAYSAKHKAPTIGQSLYYKGKELNAFISFCKVCYQDTIELIEGIK